MSGEAKPKGKSTKITRESLDKPLPHEPLPDKSTSNDGQDEHVKTSHADSGPIKPSIAQALRSSYSDESFRPSDFEQDDVTSLSESALECMHTLSAPETTGPPSAEPKQDHDPKASLSAPGRPGTTTEIEISDARSADAQQDDLPSGHQTTAGRVVSAAELDDSDTRDITTELLAGHTQSNERLETVKPRADVQPLSLGRLKKWFDTNIHVKISDADAVLSQSASDGENGGTLAMFQEAVLYAYQHVEPLQRLVKVLQLRNVELGAADTESWLPKDVVSGDPAEKIDTPMRSKEWILQEASKTELRERFFCLLWLGRCWRVSGGRWRFVLGSSDCYSERRATLARFGLSWVTTACERCRRCFYDWTGRCPVQTIALALDVFSTSRDGSLPSTVS
ncbi:hypothetical protein LTR86_010140 [Recurvomyces mirabilis]|nr:hypothetical protein LTR86_010140 [Recurvomyces mirabilis]